MVSVSLLQNIQILVSLSFILCKKDLMVNSKLKQLELCIFSKSKQERKKCSNSASYILKIWFHRNFPIGSLQLVLRTSLSIRYFVAFSKYKKSFLLYMHYMSLLNIVLFYPIFNWRKKSIIFKEMNPHPINKVGYQNP